jgi:hypothetical protein
MGSELPYSVGGRVLDWGDLGGTVGLLAVSLDVSDAEGGLAVGVVGGGLGDDGRDGLGHSDGLNVSDGSGWDLLRILLGSGALEDGCDGCWSHCRILGLSIGGLSILQKDNI